MVDYEYGTLFNDDSVKKEIIIKYGNTTITNEDLFNQELELDESLCSEEQLKFGSCEASVIKFRVANIVSPIKGQWINVSMAIGGHNENPIQLGVYKVESDKPTSDRKWREIVAYDALYDMINDDVSAWYNSVLPNKNTSMPLSQFRKLFLQKYGVQEEADGALVNDGMIVTRTIEPDELSGAKVITAICELNGCFGHIGRNGKFKNVHLVQGIKGLYPRNDLYPSDDLYPRDSKTTPIGKGIYITCEYEDFVTTTITGVDIYKEENLIGGSAGGSENKYVAEDNFLVYGKKDQEISTIANNLLSAIRGVDYRPFDAECKGNPCFEVGDPVRFSTKYEIVESYILSRTLKGTQALKDSYSADGAEKYETNVNSVRRETSQLSGKTEQLEREFGEQKQDIDEVNQEIGNINSSIGSLNVSLQQTSDGLLAEVSRAISAEEIIGSRVSITENNIALEVTRAKGAEETLSGRINITESDINLEVSRAKGAESDLYSRISFTDSSITAEVSRATQAEGDLSSRITITANQISSKVSAGEVQSLIEQNASLIRLQASSIVVDSTYFKVSQSGYITSTGGSFGPFTLDSSGFSSGSSGTTIWSNMIRTGYITQTQNGSELEIGVSSKDVTIRGDVYLENVYNNSTTSDPNLHISPTGYLNTKGGSSKKWKHDVDEIKCKFIDPHKLYDVKCRQFIYNDDYISKNDCRRGKFIPGFIIEELLETYPIAVDMDENGNPATWSPSMFIAPIVYLLQEQNKRIEELEKTLLEGGMAC